jgi:hypothetical protein
MKTLNDDTESPCLRDFDYATDTVSGSNLFSDREERERIREHAKNRLENLLNQSHGPGAN